MAAGDGRRMRPLSEHWPKPVLPVDGRPVVATLLRELAGTGIAHAWVVTGHLAEQVEALVGDGSAFGLEARAVRQPEPLGSGDAARRALAAGAAPPLLVTAADTVYRPGDLALARERWLASGAPAGLGVRTGCREGQTPVQVVDGFVTAIGGKSSAAQSGAPLWFMDAGTARSLDDLPGPPFELSRLFRGVLERSEEIAALDLGPTRDLTRPEDVVLENFPYLWKGG
jgi:GTP:adenosylcobinamide-phosphate guanylyltransferase